MIDDDILLLYYGDELDDSDRREVDAALVRDPALKQRFENLVADLERLRTAPCPAPARDIAAGWHHAISDIAKAEDTREPAAWAPIFALAAGLGILAIGIAIGLRLSPDAGSHPQIPAVVQTPAAEAVPDDPGQQPAFTRGLADYMQTARVQLVALDPADDYERAAVIGEIVAHNRAFERAARERGADDIARVLRAFEQVLMQLAQETATADDVRRDVDKLSFEYGAMITRIAPRASKQPYTL